MVYAAEIKEQADKRTYVPDNSEKAYMEIFYFKLIIYAILYHRYTL